MPSIWTYAYAGALMEVLDQLREDHGIQIVYEEFSRWLHQQNEDSWSWIFEESFDEELEVSHPLKASPFRTVASGTFGILLLYKERLGSLRQELLQSLVDAARKTATAEVRGGAEIFKPFSAVKNFFNVPFGQNAYVILRTLFTSLDPNGETLSTYPEPERQRVQLLQEFDPKTILINTLQLINEREGYELNDITSLYIALDEPLDSTLVDSLRQAVTFLDLSQWQREKEFSFVCMALAQCANAAKDPDVQNAVTEKLTDAWIKMAQQPAQYLSILNAMLVVIANSNQTNRISEFYKWWKGIIEKTEKQIPQEVYETAVLLTRHLPVAHQEGLAEVKNLLAMNT